MESQVAELVKLGMYCATVLGGILGSAKMVGGALERRPEPIREYDAKFVEGDKRMDRIERQVGDHEKRFSDIVKDHADLRVEMAELRPMFQSMQEKVGHLKGQANEIEGTLRSILSALPPGKQA